MVESSPFSEPEMAASVSQNTTALAKLNPAANLPPLLLASILDAIQDGVVVVDGQWQYVYVNGKAAAVLGRSAQDLLGQPLGDDFTLVAGQLFLEMCQRTLAEGQPVCLAEYPSTGNRWFETRLYPEPPGLLICFTDVTDRKLAEIVARNNEYRSESLVEAAPVGIFHTNAEGHCLYVNDRWSQITGLSAAEARGSGWLQTLHPEDRDRVFQAWYQAAQANQPFHQEYRFQRADQTVAWVFGQAAAEYDRNGQLQGYIGTITDISDISDRKHRELKLKRKAQQEAALHRVFQAIRNSLDLATIFTTATAETAQLLGGLDCVVVQYFPDRGVWQHIAEFRHPRPGMAGSSLNTIGLEIPDTNNPFAAQLKRLEKVQVNDTQGISDAVNQDVAQKVPGAWLLVPIILDDRVWGSFTIHVSQSPFTWQSSQVALVQAVVNQLEVAIQQASLYQQAQLELAERCRTEAALVASETRFKNLAANIPGAIFNYLLYPDGSTQILYMSPSCLNVWEVDVPTIEDNNQTLADMVYRDDLQPLMASVLASARTLTQWHHEWRIITPSGKLKWLQATGQPQALEDSIVAWDCIILDVSQQKQAELELRHSEERYRLLAENINDLVALHKLDGHYLYVSPSVTMLLGYQPEELLGRDPYDFFHPDDCETILQRSHRKVLTGSSDSVTYRMRHRAGHYIWFETLTRPIISPDGTITQLQTTSRDVTDRIQAQQQLRHEAHHDALTGLPNRHRLLERLTAALQRQASQDHYNFAVLFLDLDRFKVINDSLGHLAGDQLLVVVAYKLQSVLRSVDLVARLGGDEFVILLEDITDLQAVIQAIQRIFTQLQDPFMVAGRNVYITASIGLVWGNSRYNQAEELLRDADLAMYRAKSCGRARYEIFDPEMHRQALEQLHLEHDLRQSLDNQDFVLHYQPIVALDTGCLAGFEALIRWQHPQRGLLQPGIFMETAEETGLITTLDCWALRTACQQLKQWQQQFPHCHHLKVSVNLSAHDLHQPNLLDYVDSVLADVNWLQPCLTLEITESMLIERVEETIELLQDFKKRGIHMSLDDFGTGYASLNYLHRLPLDNLKIDRSFISQMQKGQKNYQIIETILSLSQQLGLHSIAEGIETEEQLHQLRQLGYQFGQGYLFSRPLSAPNLEILLANPSLKLAGF